MSRVIHDPLYFAVKSTIILGDISSRTAPSTRPDTIHARYYNLEDPEHTLIGSGEKRQRRCHQGLQSR